MRSLGIDLGGSKLLACVTDESGTMLGSAVRSTGRGTGPAAAAGLVAEVARELLPGGGAFDAVGIGFPGLVDFARGIARSSVMLDGWRDVPFTALVADTLGVDVSVMDNDVNAAAVAELARRAASPPDCMLFVAVGTGIGGAITIGDKLWRGHTGVAGEIGNVTIDRHGELCWCGRRGCLNTSASGSAIARDLAPGMALADLIEARHPGLAEATGRAADALGIGLGNALNLLNPSLVVLGGGVAELGQPWIQRVASAARQEAFPEAGVCRFESARAGYQAGAIGAALLGLEELRARRTTTRPAPAGRAATAAPGGAPPS